MIWPWSRPWPPGWGSSIWDGFWKSHQKISFLSGPAHPYTRALLSASFTPGIWQGKRLVLKGGYPVRPGSAGRLYFSYPVPGVLCSVQESGSGACPAFAPAHTVSLPYVHPWGEIHVKFPDEKNSREWPWSFSGYPF